MRLTNKIGALALAVGLGATPASAGDTNTEGWYKISESLPFKGRAIAYQLALDIKGCDSEEGLPFLLDLYGRTKWFSEREMDRLKTTILSKAFVYVAMDKDNIPTGTEECALKRLSKYTSAAINGFSVIK
jgi:hypothetical protein